MLAAVSVLEWVRILRGEGTRRTWAVYAIVNAVGLLTHVWFGFVVLAEVAAAALLQRRTWRPLFLAACASACPFALLWSPIFWGQLHNGATSWMPAFRLRFLVDPLLEFYVGPPAILVYVLVYGVTGGLAAMAGREAIRDFFQPPVVRCACVALAITLLVPLGISVFKSIYWPGRYTIVALPMTAALLGGIMARFAPRPMAAGFFALLLGIGMASHVARRQLVPEAPMGEGGQSDRTTAQYILRHARADDTVVFTSLSRASADYYFRRAGAGARFVEINFPAENVEHFGWGLGTVAPRRWDLVEAEAVALAERLRSAAAGHRIWVYYGFDPRPSSLLKQELDRVLVLEADLGLAGPYHNRVRVYGGSR
jgi:hypothetical protein